MPREQAPEVKILSGVIEMVSVADIRNHPKNARKGDVQAIADSIKEHGFYGRLLVQKSTGYIIKGNHSFLGGVSHGMTRFPVEWLDVDDDEALAILAVDNAVSDKAGYHDEKLVTLLSEIALRRGEKGLAGTGYTEKHLDALKEKLVAAQARGEERAAKRRGSGGSGETRLALVIVCESLHQQIEWSNALKKAGYDPVRTELDARTKLSLA